MHINQQMGLIQLPTESFDIQVSVPFSEWFAAFVVPVVTSTTSASLCFVCGTIPQSICTQPSIIPVLLGLA